MTFHKQRSQLLSEHDHNQSIHTAAPLSRTKRRNESKSSAHVLRSTKAREQAIRAREQAVMAREQVDSASAHRLIRQLVDPQVVSGQDFASRFCDGGIDELFQRGFKVWQHGSADQVFMTVPDEVEAFGAGLCSTNARKLEAVEKVIKERMRVSIQGP
jgi:hypothetical protein